MIATRIKHLFATVYPKSLGRPYTLREAADKINEDAGEELISVAYLSQLRKGDKREPAFNKLAGVAKLFGVSTDYFLDDETAARTDQQLALVAAMREQGVDRVATRALGLSANSLEAILGMIENARKIEGLADDEGDAPAQEQ
ncbi:helix-turn-helix transcriptional regulator [Catenulispora yoronensis]|uniref:helix-turn-helix domain-containing protein n=1 Tax=Catenulispora yoronensis TaxID=450799 RepID=UPI0031DA50BF